MWHSLRVTGQMHPERKNAQLKCTFLKPHYKREKQKKNKTHVEPHICSGWWMLTFEVCQFPSPFKDSSWQRSNVGWPPLFLTLYSTVNSYLTLAWKIKISTCQFPTHDTNMLEVEWSIQIDCTWRVREITFLHDTKKCLDNLEKATGRALLDNSRS